MLPNLPKIMAIAVITAFLLSGFAVGEFVQPGATKSRIFQGDVVSDNSSHSLNNTTLESFYSIDASGANKTINLPNATDSKVIGVPVTISLKNDPGAYYLNVTAVAGLLGGANGLHYLGTTDPKASITVYSDGTNYPIESLYGTWALSG